jgi:hypothetical protein
MATSGTWAFNLDIPKIVEKAYQKIGEEARTGWNYRTARESLDLLLLEWQNRGLNLWTIKNASQTLTAGTATYSLSAEKLDIIEAVIRTEEGETDQTDINMRRVSVSTYARQTNKNTQGRPTQYFVQRKPDGIDVTVWPVPDSSTTYVLNYWYMERVEDTGADGTNTVDVPARFLPALIAGLAYQLALESPKAIQAIPTIKQEYVDQLDLAMDSAREKASVRFVPRVY